MTDPRVHRLAEAFGLTITGADETAVLIEPNLAFRRLAGFARQHPHLFSTFQGPVPFRVRSGRLHQTSPTAAPDHGIVALHA